MHKTSRAVFALALALVVPTYAFARSNADHRVLPFGYPSGGSILSNGIVQYPSDGRALSVGCNPHALCQFIFPSGTKITAKALQDAHDWTVPDTTYGPDQRAIIVVKAKSTDALDGKVVRTQLVVLTSSSAWPFTISLYSSPRAPLEGTRIAFMQQPAPRPASRGVAASSRASMPSQAASVAATPATPAPAMPCGVRSPIKYAITGDADFRPLDAFNDTAGHICLVLPQTLQDAPVVYSQRGGSEEIVNYHTWAQGLFVDGIPNAIVLRDGADGGSARVYVRKAQPQRHSHFLFF